MHIVFGYLAYWSYITCRNLDLCGSSTFTKFQVLKGSSFSYVSEWNHGLFLSCRALKKKKKSRFPLLIQRKPEKGFYPSRCCGKIEQTNHVRPYLTWVWFRLCLFSQSWHTARCARGMVSLYLFSIRNIVYRKPSSGHRDWWNHGPTRLFFSYISASKGFHSKEWLLALQREKWFASTKLQSILLQSQWALSSASQ